MGSPAVLKVSIISDAKGAVAGFKETEAATGGLMDTIKGFAPSAAVIGTAVGGAAVAAGKALYDLGSTFDNVKDTIRVGTGATGEALDGLYDSARNVATSIPASFEDAGTKIADINTRMGLTGDTLETVASQYLEAGRILGTEVDVNATSAAFTAFGIEGDKVSGALDTLFQVSQATGVGMNELATGAGNNAQTMQELGFTFEDSVALFGALDKAGIDATATMGAMKKGMLNLAQPGESTADAFKRVTGELQGYIDAGDTGAALDIAGKVFGTKGAATMVQALQSGTLSMNDLLGATGATSDTILQVGEDTMDAAEKWEILKNKGLNALEPLASGVFDLVGNALGGLLDWINTADFSGLTGIFDTIAPVLSDFAGLFGDLVGKILPVVSAIQDALTPVVEALVPVFQTAFDTIGGVITAALDIISGVFEVIQGLFTGDWEAVWEGAQKIVGGAIDGIVSLFTGFWDLLTGIFRAGVDLISGIWGAAWDWITIAVSNAADGVISFVSDLPGNIVKALGNLGSLLLDAGAAIIQGLIDGITGAIGGAISAVIDGISGLVDSVLGFLGIHSPSRVFRDIGINTGKGLVLGIDDMAPKVADAWTDLMDVPGGPTLTARLDAHAPGAHAPGSGTVYNITINGPIDELATARRIEELLARTGAIRGAGVRA